MKTQKELRQRKLMLVLPGLALPFITMIFWALGGGHGAMAQEKQTIQQKGLNMQLPGAQLKDDKDLSKLSFYQKADKDSVKFKEALQNDPYKAIDTIKPVAGIATDTYSLSRLKYAQNTDPNEQKINERLALLQQQISQPSGNMQQQYPGASRQPKDDDVAKLEAMMESLNQKNANDPEMAQLNGMLDKILDIQHPDREKEKIKEASLKNKKQVYTVTSTHDDNLVQLLSGSPGPGDKVTGTTMQASGYRNAFYDVTDDAPLKGDEGNSVEAVVPESTAVTAGATIKLRLLNDIYISGRLIPKGQLVFGTCSVSDDRLRVSVSSIRFNNSILPVSLQVFDMDGIAGIYIPGAISRDVAKSSSDEAIQGMNLYSYDNSIGAQAATAGVQAAKTLFSKKVKQIKVTVNAGYQLLLKDGNAQ